MSPLLGRWVRYWISNPPIETNKNLMNNHEK